jgi:hypothetical protein
MPRSWVHGCPIADIRWLLWQLAEEAEWQSFLFVATGQAAHDPHGFLAVLHHLLWSRRPFHVHPEHGMVRTLRTVCGFHKSQLLFDLARFAGATPGAPSREPHGVALARRGMRARHGRPP